MLQQIPLNIQTKWILIIRPHGLNKALAILFTLIHRQCCRRPLPPPIPTKSRAHLINWSAQDHAHRTTHALLPNSVMPLEDTPSAPIATSAHSARYFTMAIASAPIRSAAQLDRCLMAMDASASQATSLLHLPAYSIAERMRMSLETSAHASPITQFIKANALQPHRYVNLDSLSLVENANAPLAKCRSPNFHACQASQLHVWVECGVQQHQPASAHGTFIWMLKHTTASHAIQLTDKSLTTALAHAQWTISQSMEDANNAHPTPITSHPLQFAHQLPPIS